MSKRQIFHRTSDRIISIARWNIADVLREPSENSIRKGRTSISVKMTISKNQITWNLNARLQTSQRNLKNVLNDDTFIRCLMVLSDKNRFSQFVYLELFSLLAKL